MRRRLYTSNYIGMAGYLMDFGFGGFIGYGKGVSCCVVEEELKRRMMYDGCGRSARSVIGSGIMWRRCCLRMFWWKCIRFII